MPSLSVRGEAAMTSGETGREAGRQAGERRDRESGDRRVLHYCNECRAVLYYLLLAEPEDEAGKEKMEISEDALRATNCSVERCIRQTIRYACSDMQ